MNYSTAIFLINPKVRAVRGIYDYEAPGKEGTATRGTFKTLDQSIKVGDYVLVPTATRHKMTVNKIVEVDVEAPIETGEQIQWVIGVVDRAAYEEILAMESKAIKLMKDAEKTHQQEELKRKLFQHVDMEKLNSLEISKASDVVDLNALPAPPLRSTPPAPDYSPAAGPTTSSFGSDDDIKF